MNTKNPEVVFEDLKHFTASISKALHGFGNFEENNGTYTFRSILAPTEELNEHLVWLFTMLNTKKTAIRTMTLGGGKVVCRCYARSYRHPVRLQARALAMAHILGIDIEIV